MSDQVKDQSILYEFWNHIPIVAMVSEDEFKKISDHPIRNAMIIVMRKGILDPETSKRRYAMNLTELLQPLQDFFAEHYPNLSSPKKTALYHHRDQLLEEGLIKEVATFLEGKRYVTYYGRTARAFIAVSHVTKENQFYDFLHEIIRYLNPDLPRDDLVKITDMMKRQNEKVHQKTTEWLEEHVELLNNLDIDAIELYKLLMNIFNQSMADPEVVERLNNAFDIRV